MADGWGGSRPGSGRKSDDAKARQSATRDHVLDIADEIDPLSGETRGKALWRTLFKQAMAGDIIAANTIIPYIAGGKPKEPLDINATIDINMLSWERDYSPMQLPPPALDVTYRELPDGDDHHE